LILMKGHMAVGLLGTGLSGFSEFSKEYSTYSRSGYYYGETTSTSFPLGKIPEDVKYTYVDKVVIDVED